MTQEHVCLDMYPLPPVGSYPTVHSIGELCRIMQTASSHRQETKRSVSVSRMFARDIGLVSKRRKMEIRCEMRRPMLS